MNLRVDTGLPHPLGATWDGSGVNFALFSANAEKVELCLFDPNGRRQIGAHRPARVQRTRSGTAILPDVRPGQLYGYRVSGPYAPEEGHRFNPQQAADRPLCQGAGRRPELARRLLWLPRRLAARGFQLRPPRQRLRHAEMPGRRHGAYLGRRHPAARALGRDDHLRGACQGHDGTAPGPAAAAPRHLRRPRRSAGHRSSGQARRDRDRAAARPGLLRRPLPGREGSARTTGATTRFCFHAPAAALHLARTRRRRVQAHGASACTRPASRSSSTSSTTTPPRATSSARRSPFAASTTPATTSWPRIRASISTRPAAATR